MNDNVIKKGRYRNNSKWRKEFIHEALFAIILCLIGVFIWMNIDVEMGKEMASEYELGQVRLGEFQLYTNGEELYRKLFEDINDAEKYTYIHFIL